MPIILFYGTLWGMFEAILGGLMHSLRFRLTGSMMMGIGAYCLVSCVMKRKKDTFRCLGVAVVAASLKLLSMPFYHKTIFSRSISHPVVSILSEGMVAGVVLYFAFRFLKGKSLSPALLSGVYVLLGLFIGVVARNIHWAVFSGQLPVNCISSGGIPTILFCGIGGWLGSRPELIIELKKPYYIYGSALNLIIAVLYYSVSVF